MNAVDPESATRRAREKPIAESMRTDAQYRKLFDACIAANDRYKLQGCDTHGMANAALVRECDRKRKTLEAQYAEVAAYLREKGIDPRDGEFFGLVPHSR